jgi:hypothetical protein
MTAKAHPANHHGVRLDQDQDDTRLLSLLNVMLITFMGAFSEQGSAR